MKKRKFKKYVLPTMYIMIIGVMAFGITFLSRSLQSKKVENDEHYNYTMSVFNEQENEENKKNKEDKIVEEKVEKPFQSEKVRVAKEFYSKDDTTENQQNALILYENTYMPNTGILYESDEVFDVYSVMNGTVKDIKEDEILGTVLKIENTNKITTIYYTLGETKVKVGDTVKKGQIIATSGTSKLKESQNQTLLFEVYMDGVLINPNNLYEKNISELN